MESSLIQIAEKSLAKYRFQFIAGASVFENGTLVAWFNNQAFHSASLALDLLHNAIINTAIGDSYNIKVANAPRNYTKKVENTHEVETELALFFDFVMPILSTLYILFYIKVC